MYFLQFSTNMKKMCLALPNIDKNLKEDKVATRAKHLTIKELEKNIVMLGFNPNISTPVQSLLWQKDNEIVSVLKKKLHLHDTEHVHTSELVTLQENK